METTAGESPKSSLAASNVTPPASTARDRQGNPVHTPGICRKILIEANAISEAAETVRRVQTERRVVKYSYGVYRLNNGRFIGAETLGNYFNDPRRWESHYQDDGYRGRASSVARYVKNGWYPATARCTDGRDISRDTGVRIEYTRPNTGGGLIGAVITGVAGALADAGNHTSGSSYSPAPTVETAAPSSSASKGVSRDGDGWVSVDGRKVGRVSFSYGKYRITCSKGYNSGWGSNSAFGQSFTIDVNNRDEATSVLLKACKH